MSNLRSEQQQTERDSFELTRRDWLGLVPRQSTNAAILVFLLIHNPTIASAANAPSLNSCLYTIARVREATVLESRLVTTGKFQDVQRANVKLAIQFLLDNYRLYDTIVAASAYLEDPAKRNSASLTGQTAVQDLQTIMEYYDASTVANLKVNSMSDERERIVLQGLGSARNNLDLFVSYFPKDQVDIVRRQVQEENDLNRQEWDRTLGDIINLPPAV
jgi:hypothetical protein